MLFRKTAGHWRHRVLAVRCGADPVLHALAPLGLAAARGTALVMDLDEEVPSYPGSTSLANLVVSHPRRDDLRPVRSGVAVLSNGLVSPLRSRPGDRGSVGRLAGCGVSDGRFPLPPTGICGDAGGSGDPVVARFSPSQGDRPFGLSGGVQRTPSPASGGGVAAPGQIPYPAHARGHGASSSALGEGLGAGLADVMALIERLVDTLLLSDFPTDRATLTQHVSRMVATEAPLAPAGVVEKVVDSLIGLGPLEELLRSRERPAGVEEVISFGRLLVVPLTGGMSLANALMMASRQTHPQLRSEVAQTLRRSRQEGLARALAASGGLLGDLFQRMAGAHSSGFSLVRAVVTHVENLHSQRRMEALSRIRSLSVTLAVPLTLLIVPGCLLVMVGPSVASRVTEMLSGLLGT